MKQTTKNVGKFFAVAMLSATVAGVTTYALRPNEKEEMTTFVNQFPQSAQIIPTAFGTSSAGAVDLTKAAEASVNAVVHIKSTQLGRVQTIQQQPDLFDYIFGNPYGGGRQRQVQTQPRVGFGSGVIISKDGYIVTNNHVIEGADEISVKLNDSREYVGRIIGTDSNTDLALVKIEADDDLPIIPIGDSDELKIGEWVLAVGNPFNLTSTVTAGIVSAKARKLGIYDNGIESFIQTDAAINQGNSGGALVNANGELVGINSVLSSPTGAYAGYGFAIPTSIMTKVVTDLKEFGAVQRALLGISGNDLNAHFNDAMKKKAEELGVIEGVWVGQVVEGSSAAAADIQADDVIIGIDNKNIKTMAELQEELAKHRPGDKVKVKIIRDKKEKTLNVELKNAQGNTNVVKNVDMDILGAAFKELPDELKRQLNLGYGLQVTGLTDGKMKDAGIRKGVILLKANNQPLRQVSDLEEVLKVASQSPEQVLFITAITPAGRRVNFAVDLSQEE
ncbi:MAG: Do family serine endopeptidase [Bacteroidaceae bacterium]|nr:Do family serine endopeptidase [Bacteroidaceae bacterium]